MYYLDFSFVLVIDNFWSIYLGVIILTCGVNSDRRSFARIALYLASDVTEEEHLLELYMAI